MDLLPRSTHPRGGLYFEDFEVGALLSHRLTRTVTGMDNMLFSDMTLNPQPLHIDAHFCATETEWGRPIVNSLFTLGLMIGISVNDTTVGTTIGNLGMTDTRFPAPLLRGRHDPRDDGNRDKARVAIAPDGRHRRVRAPRLQAGRHAGGRVPAPGADAQAPGAAAALTVKQPFPWRRSRTRAPPRWMRGPPARSGRPSRRRFPPLPAADAA